MDKKIKIIFIIILIIVIILLSFLIENENNVIETSSDIISNKKIEWGMKRNKEHNQPDVGEDRRKILEENNGICLGNKDEKIIYLTFDEGYEAGFTSKILEILKENEVKATFFITAHYLNTNEELVKQMIEENHIVANHTVNHESMSSLTEEEIKSEVMDLHTAIYQKFGYEMKYIRPPKGEFSEKSLKYTNNLGYKTIMWSFAYEDWDENNQPNEEKAKEKILENLHNGEIMLLHGNSKTNTDILDEVIKKSKEMGYSFKSLDEFE